MSELMKRYELEKEEAKNYKRDYSDIKIVIIFLILFIGLFVFSVFKDSSKIEISEHAYIKVNFMKNSLDRAQNKFILEKGNSDKIPVLTMIDFRSLGIRQEYVNFTIKEIETLLNLITKSIEDDMISKKEYNTISSNIIEVLKRTEKERTIIKSKNYDFEREKKMKEIKENLKKVEKHNE